MNGNLVVGVIVVVLIALALRALFRQRKRGGCSCGCKGCGACRGCDHVVITDGCPDCKE